MAVHPDDSARSDLGWVARLFTGFEGLPTWLWNPSQPSTPGTSATGCWSEMRCGAVILEAIAWFGTRQRLFYVHLRDVRAVRKTPRVF